MRRARLRPDRQARRVGLAACVVLLGAGPAAALARPDAGTSSRALRPPEQPFREQAAKLTGANENGDAAFGESVALAANGDTALVGGPGDGGNVGAVWVFTRSGSTWVEQGAKLSELDGGLFGQSVALSANGTTALIGSPGTNTDAGAAWVFTRSRNAWTPQHRRLTGGGEIDGAWFGASVALSSDGHTALVGGPLDGGGNGAVWVFVRARGSWVAQGRKLTEHGADSAEGGFGTSVALSANGDTALIGNGGGAAYVLTRSGATWTQQGAPLKAATGDGSFGCAVALSGDGKTALVGDCALTGPGSAWLFARSGSTWRRGSELTAGGEAGGAQFGRSVALSANGDSALVGAPLDDDAGGAAWLFTRSGATWTRATIKLTGADESGEAEFGSSAALSGDGSSAFVGGFLDNASIGAVWAYDRQ